MHTRVERYSEGEKRRSFSRAKWSFWWAVKGGIAVMMEEAGSSQLVRVSWFG